MAATGPSCFPLWASPHLMCHKQARDLTRLSLSRAGEVDIVRSRAGARGSLGSSNAGPARARLPAPPTLFTRKDTEVSACHHRGRKSHMWQAGVDMPTSPSGPRDLQWEAPAAAQRVVEDEVREHARRGILWGKPHLCRNTWQNSAVMPRPL